MFPSKSNQSNSFALTNLTFSLVTSSIDLGTANERSALSQGAIGVEEGSRQQEQLHRR